MATRTRRGILEMGWIADLSAKDFLLTGRSVTAATIVRPADRIVDDVSAVTKMTSEG